jgi:hypothetical protein
VSDPICAERVLRLAGIPGRSEDQPGTEKRAANLKLSRLFRKIFLRTAIYKLLTKKKVEIHKRISTCSFSQMNTAKFWLSRSALSNVGRDRRRRRLNARYGDVPRSH